MLSIDPEISAVERLPNRKPAALIEGVKRAPIDIIRREPSLATPYAEVLYSRTEGRGREPPAQTEATPVNQALKQRSSLSGIGAMTKSAWLFAQGVISGMAFLAVLLLFQHGSWDSMTGEATTTVAPNTAPLASAPMANGSASQIRDPNLAASEPSDLSKPETGLPRQQLEQELHELQAVNHLLTAQVEDLRRKLVITKSDLSTMTTTRDYYVQKVREVEDALLDQKRQNWVVQRALGRALDKINP